MSDQNLPNEDTPLGKKSKKKKSLDFDKEKAKLDFFDPRGVQTLFRTLSRNHYNLLRMVDNKASIILTVNSIIISLLFGAAYLAPEADRAIIREAARILFLFSLLSMIFALISMLPHKYVGRKFRSSNYKGSLYAGNYANQSLEEFKAEFERIIKSGNMVYNEMVDDFYFLGRSIALKQKLVWVSVLIFLIGLISALWYGITHGLPT